jgi:type I restriction enzyme, R subunit
MASTTSTDSLHPDGTPMSAQQFMESLFGKLPEFFKDEAELRTLWSAPDTRKKLLQGLAEKGFGREQLSEMQRIIDAEKSDLFDVLAYVAYICMNLARHLRHACRYVGTRKPFPFNANSAKLYLECSTWNTSRLLLPRLF